MLSIFWICAFLICYVYLGYPLLLASGLFGKRRLGRRRCIQPSLSILNPARNEENVIRAKLLNLISQNYPLEKLEILVGNDGSSDRTAAVVSEFIPLGVQLVSADEPCGKSSIQNALVERAQSEILVFTDADCTLPTNAIRTMVQHFADPRVGLVTGCASFRNRGQTPIVENESLYWKYERWLREQESDRGLLAMASGSPCDTVFGGGSIRMSAMILSSPSLLHGLAFGTSSKRGFLRQRYSPRTSLIRCFG